LTTFVVVNCAVSAFCAYQLFTVNVVVFVVCVPIFYMPFVIFIIPVLLANSRRRLLHLRFLCLCVS
jgi:hypothetical protein